MVSRAFQVLSDPDKRSKYDKFGGDPENRAPAGAGGGGAGGPPFGFPGRAYSFEDEISAEELFNSFFSGGFGPFGKDKHRYHW